MISISFGNNNGYSDYDDKKPNKIYRKITSDSIIYYYYSPYPRGSSHYQYLMPIITKIIPRTNRRDDDNNDFYYRQYYIPQPYYYPVYPPYYYPAAAPQPRPYYPYPMYRSFATPVSRFTGNSQPLIMSNCMEIGKGKYEWNGGEGTATGSSCDSARRNYCNKYGPTNCGNGIRVCAGEQCPQKGTANPLGGPNLGGLLNSDGKNPAPGPIEDALKGLQKTLYPNLDNKGDKAGGASVGDSPNCKGCTNNGDMLAYTGCLVMKQGCEIQGAITNGLNQVGGGLGQFALPIMVGGGLILLILLLKR